MLRICFGERLHLFLKRKKKKGVGGALERPMLVTCMQKRDILPWCTKCARGLHEGSGLVTSALVTAAGTSNSLGIPTVLKHNYVL